MFFIIDPYPAKRTVPELARNSVTAVTFWRVFSSGGCRRYKKNPKRGVLGVLV
jgi:hypothetical protein